MKKINSPSPKAKTIARTISNILMLVTFSKKLDLKISLNVIIILPSYMSAVYSALCVF